MEQMTAVEWLIKQIQNRQNGIVDTLPVLSTDELYDKAKQMEEEQKYETSAFWFGIGVLAVKENRIEELKPNK